MKTTKYYIHSLPSTVGGVVAASAAIALLTRDAQHTGLSLENALMPVLVGLTVLFGHEAWRALKEWKLLSALLGIGLALFGSVIIVGETMGRRAETRDAKIAQAEKTVDQYAVIAADYQRAAKLVTEAEAWVAGECRSGAGPKCKGNEFVLAQRTAHAEKLKAQLEKATAPAPVDSKADKIAYWAALFGAPKATAKEVFQNFDPFSLSLFLELGAVLGFGFGVRTRKVVVSSFSDTVQTSFSAIEAPDLKAILSAPLPDNDPEPPKGRKTKSDNVVWFPVQSTHPVIRALETSGRTMSNGELAKAMGVSDSEASKRWQEVVDQLTVGWSGKYRVIGLKAWKATA